MSSGVLVAEEGNRRRGEMSSAEVEQCVLDINSWFKRKNASEFTPSNSTDIQALEKALDIDLPQSLRALLKNQNVEIWFNEFKALSSNEIINKLDSYSNWKCWSNGFIPLGADLDDNILVIDTFNENKVHECSEAGIGKTIADSMSSYLEGYRDNLLSGKFEFVEDVGTVERSKK